MIILDCPQGEALWSQARVGLPTASKFDKILTPTQLKVSKASSKYRNQILAEWICGYPIDWGNKSQFMERGNDLEPRARQWYEFARDVEVEQVGLVLRDDEKVGGSPDGLVGDDGGLEIKCPALHTHIDYLLDPLALIDNYHLQVQGLLYLTGRDWWDLISYSPVLPPVVERVGPDPDTQEALEAGLEQFIADLDEKKLRLAEHRETRPDGYRSPLPGETSKYIEELRRELVAA